MKKGLSVILSLVLVLAAFPLTGIDAFAESDFISGQCGDNVEYYYDSSTNTLTIGGTGKMYDYTFGSSGYGSRPSPFYDYNYNLRFKHCNVVIEEGVTSVGKNAFREVSLCNVTLPDSVTVIEEGAFCISRLNSISFGAGLMRVKQKAFVADSAMTVSYPGTQAQWDAVSIEFVGNWQLLQKNRSIKLIQVTRLTPASTTLLTA